MNATSTSAREQAELVQALNQAIPSTLGPCLLGSYLACVFYGVTLLQTYQYFSRYYRRDSIYLYVLVVVLTSTLGHFCGYIEHIYSVFLPHKEFRQLSCALAYQLSSVVVTLTVAFLVQSVYAHRAYICHLGTSRTWFRTKSDTLIRRLVIYTLNTGIITTRSSEEYLLQRDLLFPAVQMLRELSVSILK
ncbi:hypothetical protein Clacol_001138 [Clathrus columnatus]|uniref:Uncharacterized protein n=1 Tax=Clathrus columnatus TaxID=1419009 RepID=A0AAV5A0K0_9AGAM|nr:hypothetical protein Clacol_001138 [Clathrus columnatus]